MAKKFDIDKFNEILRKYNQCLQAIEITGKKIVLSNGLVMESEKDVRLCKRRVVSGNDVWKENFDRLYGNDTHERSVAEKECQSITSIQGGISCQKTHGEKIKKNLNSGTPWNKGMSGNYPYKVKHTKESKSKISKANSGYKNGMWGKKLSVDAKLHLSKIMQEKIISGKFTPNSNNRNTHWDCQYNGKKYRSSWEALYQCLDEQAEYEALRIKYYFDNRQYVYIVDFINHNTKTVIEVKPTELINDKKTQAKINSAKNWCEQNGYRFILADKDYLKSFAMPNNLCDFDINTQRKIRNFYETR